MPTGRSHAAREAFAGAVAAGVWAAQQPLDRRVFGVAFDDTELLGKLVTRGPAWPAVGVGLHLLNGAALGAMYATVAPRLPLPPWARGPAAALVEHLATWPLTSVVERLHPARADLPALAGDVRAFAQSTWRHLLFGAVLGAVERRLHAREEMAEADFERLVSSNGHGNIERAATGVAR